MNPKPWGLGTGSLFSLIIFIFSQISAFLILFFGGSLFPYFYKYFGFSLTVSAIFSSLLSLILIYILIKISRYPLKEYLSLKSFSSESFFFWLFIFALFIGFSEFLLYKLNIQTIPEFLEKAYKTTEYPLLLFFTIIFIYPLFEEALFRGFLFKSIESSSLGGNWAVFLTSFFWAILHIQYNIAVIIIVFIAGLIFGFSRLKTSSLYVPLILHILQNLASSIFFYFSLK